MDKWLKICHTGELKFIELPNSLQHDDPTYPFLEAVYREIDCTFIEIVRMPGFSAFFPGEPVIIIDECGKLKEGFEDRINNLCTLNYAPGVDCIVGDAILGARVGAELIPYSYDLYLDFARTLSSCFTDVSFSG